MTEKKSQNERTKTVQACVLRNFGSRNPNAEKTRKERRRKDKKGNTTKNREVVVFETTNPLCFHNIGTTTQQQHPLLCKPP